MENVEIRFYDNDAYSYCKISIDLKRQIQITIEDETQAMKFQSISLNKMTALKLIKELKRNIGKLNEEEAIYGNW